MKIKKIIAFICFFHPFIIGFLFVTNRMDFIWTLSENYKIYNLTYAIISFLSFSVGFVILIKDKSEATTLVLLTTIFIVYHVFSWSFSTKPYKALIHLNEKHSISLVHHGSSALSSYSLDSLELIEKKYLIFIKYKRIKAFEKIYFKKMELIDNETVKFEFIQSTGKQMIEYINIYDLN